MHKFILYTFLNIPLSHAATLSSNLKDERDPAIAFVKKTTQIKQDKKRKALNKKKKMHTREMQKIQNLG